MLTLEDCIALSDLTPEEIAAIAEHEHIPRILAAELGHYLVETPDGCKRIRAIIRDDIAAAEKRRDREKVLRLKLCLRHFIEHHAGEMAASGGTQQADKESYAMPLKTVRLELARCPEYPEGSSDFGYEIVAPLTADGHLDLDEWKASKAKCSVRHFARGADDEDGLLIHTRRGWIFDYDPEGEEDDEPLFKLDRHLFKEGEYISVTEHDGNQRTYHIVSVR